MTKKEALQKLKDPRPYGWVRERDEQGRKVSEFTGDRKLKVVWDYSAGEAYEAEWAASYGEARIFPLRLMYAGIELAVFWVVFLPRRGDGGGDGGQSGAAVCVPRPQPGTRRVSRSDYEELKEIISPKGDLDKYLNEFGLEWDDDDSNDEEVTEDVDPYEQNDLDGSESTPEAQEEAPYSPMRMG